MENPHPTSQRDPAAPSQEESKTQIRSLQIRFDELQQENGELTRGLRELEAAGRLSAETRVATLALLEEAVRARKQAEDVSRAWEESEERYRTLFESIDQGFCILEVFRDEPNQRWDYRVLELNPAFSRQTGLNDVIGRSIREVAPGLEEEWFQTYADVATSGRAVRFERAAVPLGRYFEVYAFRVGRPEQRHVAVLFNDISVRKRAEEILLATEKRQTFLMQLADQLRPLRDPVEMQVTASRLLGEYLGANRVGYAEAQPDGETVVVVRHYTHDASGIEGTYRLEDYGTTLFREFRAGRTVIFPDIANDPLLTAEEKRAHALLELGASANKPLLKEGKLLGILFAHFQRAHHFTADEIVLLEETGERIWSAIERARSEAALRANEEHMRTLADAVPQLIWTNTADGTPSYFNRRWFEYSGLDRATSLQFGWEAIVHPDDAADSKACWQQALAEGEIFDSEYRLRSFTGEYRWFIGRNVPLRDSEGRVTGWFGTATDIERMKRAEAAVRQSESRNRIALEAVGMATWDYDSQSDRVVWNEQHFRILGLVPDGLPKAGAEFFRFVHPEDRDRVLTEFHRATTKTGVYEAEFRIVRTDGVVRWMSGFGRATERDGPRAIRMLGVMFDVTERFEAVRALRESQERLRLIVENARDYAILSLTSDRTITSWNSGAAAILGYQEHEILGQSADVIFTDEDRAAGIPAHEAVVAIAEGRALDERWHRRKDGSRFWGSGVMMAMRDAEGRTIGLVKIFRDHTPEMRSREALEQRGRELRAALHETQQAREAAEEAGRAKDRFLAILSHELRTPLTPVLIATQMMARRKDLPPGMAEDIAMIRRNIETESHLVDDLLDVTRIARNKMEFHFAPVDLHDVVRRAVEICRPTFAAKEQQLELTLGALETQGQGDARRLQQIVWNLLSNAAKFTPRGERIYLRTVNEPGRWVLHVADTGRGIEPEALPFIFEAFTQESARITRQYGGLGLGLAIARAIVLGHGGELRAESAGLGHGATFTCSLPLAPRS